MATTTFRSRIPTVIAHGEYDGLTGGCCLPDGSKIMASYVECAVQKGLFRGADDLSEVTCPEIGRTGCCCACSHLSEDEKNNLLASVVNDTYSEYSQKYQLGLTATTQCGCNEKGGNWYPFPCETFNNSSTLCGFGTEDVRFPKACCHYETGTAENGEVIGLQCSNVCTTEDCALLVRPPYGSIFYKDGSVCNYSIFGQASVECDIWSLLGYNEIVSACCDDDVEGGCTEYLTQEECLLQAGEWIDPFQNNCNGPCNCSYCGGDDIGEDG